MTPAILRAAAMMLAVQHNVGRQLSTEREQLTDRFHESRRIRREILSGSRPCGCGRLISGNKARCLACETGPSA